ncbi:chaplin family protein [Pseudarthrobacter sp. fls2-241-R2A-127]|uniref:chaplin family protein n=1 Tax=Pseudarthrobacter sp. fls2-241-R2A-127 TaxID=3040303 RepID=UPI0025536693|nr:chaplin family protein [Pseudarthrobacter sp. fls2-241-R2A-127]
MMHRNIRRCLLGTAFAGGLLAFGGVAANAADTTTSGNDGLLSGTQVMAPVTIPINVGSTSFGLLGDSAASTQNAGTPAAPAPAPAASTGGGDGIASGTQVVAPVTAPINLGATSVGLVGDSAASTQNTATSGTAPAAPAPAATTTGADGIASGTQVVAPISVPITVGATSVGGVDDSAASTQNAGTPAAPAPAPAASTGGGDGIASGTQVVAPVTAPINLGATSVGLVGDSAAGAEGAGTTGTTTAPAGSITTGGTDGLLSGTQVVAPITLPISLGATSVGVVGDSTATVVNPPVVTPPVVTPPVVNPPVVTPPIVTTPTVTTPSTEAPADQPAAGATDVRAAAAPMQANYAAAPAALANTGVNTGMLLVGLLFLAFGGLLTLVLRRKQG